MPSDKRKAKKQAYYSKVKKSRQFQAGRVLQEGMKGFLITCNNREKEALREAYNILNDFADRLVGAEADAISNNVPGDAEEDHSDGDVDDAFDKEKECLDTVKAKPASERRFQSVDSGARNCIFVKTTLPDPSLIIEAILTDIKDKKQGNSRYIMRMVPIVKVCKLDEKKIQEELDDLLTQSLEPGQEYTYCLVFKIRNNNGGINREEMIKLVGTAFHNRDGMCKVDLKNPEVTVVVEIIKNVCCIGVARNYFANKKYNLAELANTSVSNETVGRTSTEETEIEDESKSSNVKVDDVASKDTKLHEGIDSGDQEENLVSPEKEQSEEM